MTTLVSLESTVFCCESGEASFDSNVLKYRVSFSKIMKLKIKLYIYIIGIRQILTSMTFM